MKRIIAILAIVIASISMAYPCECWFRMEQEIASCNGSTLYVAYEYCGSGSYCSSSALQRAYLEASLVMMEAVIDC